MAAAVPGCRYIIHLATGAADGWQSLQAVDIDATRTLLDAVRSVTDVRRVVLASTNHTAGGVERDLLQGHPTIRPYRVDDPPRPDSEYAVANVAMEVYARFAAEVYGTCVSCLRIGTVRRSDNPRAYVNAPEFRYLGDADRVAARLQATWLKHADLCRIVDEELAAKQAFRLRFAYSMIEGGYWPHDVLAWDTNDRRAGIHRCSPGAGCRAGQPHPARALS